jgi:DNA polymerase-3 subunit alpha
MSKKKQHVMEVERDIFINGNEMEIEEAKFKGDKVPAAVPGCKANGIPEDVANHIYDEMMDFAKYAFNKSHAACYAVVAYQTAFLKYYYPVEFMAALMTSVIDNSKKVSEYILTCRNMGIELLPPDINQGESGFSVSEGKIRYALTAIKSVGRPVIDALAEERQARGPFTNIQDFLDRAHNIMNKRAIEAFIKAGALDSFGATRKQLMTVFPGMMDSLVREKKDQLEGQLSLLDCFGEDMGIKIKLPECGEYDREMMLAMEKEVLGIYVSGHPMEEYQDLWQTHADTRTIDFALDEETGVVQVKDQSYVTIGGMITGKTVKYTKNNQVMCFITVEDLVGTVEVIVFPTSYGKYAQLLVEDAKIFIRGRVSAEEDKDAKLLCEEIATFEEAKEKPAGKLFAGRGGRRGYSGNGGGYRSDSWSGGSGRQTSGGSGWGGASGGNAASGQSNTVTRVPEKGLFVQFPTMADYEAKSELLLELIKDSDGQDDVVVYVRENKLLRVLPANYRVAATADLKASLDPVFGEENVKIR